MTESLEILRKKIANAQELESVVRTMKAMAASIIGQYESAVRSLDDYYRTVQLGLSVCFKENQPLASYGVMQRQDDAATGVIVFGSDQGLVGQFNEVMVEFVLHTLADLPGEKRLWAVGERIEARLGETSLGPAAGFNLPNSINAITTLVTQVLIEMESQREQGKIDRVFIFHNRPESGSLYAPHCQQLLPLDQAWRSSLTDISWPTGNLPEVMQGSQSVMRSLVREFLFVSIFKACAESLASENASRLAAMQRAEKSIGELQESLGGRFHRLRQSGIDEELFDVLSGYEAASD